MDERLAELQGEIAEFRRLAASEPDMLYPGLAFALAELSTVWRDLERPAEAVETAREAVDLFRLLAAHDDEFNQPLAVACNNLSARLQDAGRTAAALEVAREAVDTAAGLPGDDENATILAAARLNMATQLFILGAEREGEAVLAEIGRAIRRLIEAGQREAATTQLRVLQDLAERARDNRSWAEHVALRRALSLGLPGDPAAGRAVLAYALDEAAGEAATTDPLNAAQWAEQASTEFARLAAHDPARYTQPLRQAAESWLRLVHGGDDCEAAERAARAVAAAAVPNSEPHGIALTMLAMALDGQARFDEAELVSAEALAVWRGLPDQVHRLASALNVHTGLLARAGKLDDALTAAAEAVALWRAAEAVDPETESTIFADTLRLQAMVLARCGRFEAALAVAEEGMTLVLATIVQAGIGSPAVLDEFEKLRSDCLTALGRKG